MTRDFDTVAQAVEPMQGWLRPAQARVLWDLAVAVPPGGTIVEIGSFHGKSTVVLASAAGDDVAVHAIDPHAGNDRGPGEWHGEAHEGQADHEAFTANLEAHGVRGRVDHIREFSQRAHALVDDAVDVLYVDGAHGYAPALSDIRDWGGKVRSGGAMAIHDVYTSVFVTLAVARSLWCSSEWRYVGRERSMSVYRREPVRGVERVRNAARQVANLPWFAMNLVVRSLDMVGMTRLSRLGQGPGGGVY